MKISIVELNNKSRKGTYLYIKAPKIRGAYYKFSEDDTIDPYIEYYKDRYVGKKSKAKGTIKKYRDTYKAKILGQKIKRTPISQKADRYLKKIKKRPTLESQVEKGIGQAIIRDGRTAGQHHIRQATQNLLRKLVLDKKLLEIISTEENMKKIKHRLEHRLIFIGADKKIIGKSAVFRKTTTEVIRDIKNIVGRNEEVIKQRTPALATKLTNYGYQKYDHRKDGKITTTKVHIIFRKGK